MGDPDLVARFAAIVGAHHALTDPVETAAFLTEPRDLFVGKTPVVLRPGSTAEVSAIVTLAAATRTPIVPQGGNTGLVGGQIPESGAEIVVSLGRLDRIRAVDPESDTITVEAGLPLEKVQEAAAAVDRFFPLSLGSQGSCTIGGNLATNAGGTAVLAFGNARDLVLGLEVVLADGAVWDGLRALRKDNAGYDLKHLFLGSEGTLGIITAAVLKLFPRPRAQEVAFAGVPSPEAALSLLAIARARAGAMLTSFELIPRIGLDFCLRHLPGARDPLGRAHPWYVLIEISSGGSAEGTRRLTESLLTEASSAGALSDAALASSLAQERDFWRLRHGLPEVQKPEGGSIKHDVSVPIRAVPEFIARASAAVEALVPGSRPVPFGHLGDGNIHFNVSQPPSMDKAAFLARWDEVNAAVHAIATGLGGSIAAEHGIGRLKRDLLGSVRSPVELSLMRRLKAALDPENLLNPGKVLCREPPESRDVER